MATTAKRYFSESAIAKALGTSQNFLIGLANQGILTPLVVESAHSDSRAYPAEDILALAVSRRLKSRRMPLKMIVSVCNFLRTKTIDQLEAEWAIGRKFLLSVNRCPPLPALLSHDAIFDNPAIDLKAAADAAEHGNRDA